MSVGQGDVGGGLSTIGSGLPICAMLQEEFGHGFIVPVGCLM